MTERSLKSRRKAIGVLGAAVLAFSGALCVAPTPAAAQGASLTGSWDGAYYYPGGRRSTPFTVAFRVQGGVVTGRSSEPNTINRRGGRLTADWTGTIKPNGVMRLIKTYDGSAGLTHSIIYIGAMSGGVILGEWQLGRQKGSFQLGRR